MRFKGFKTGSRVWGVASIHSDYDICVKQDEADRLKSCHPYNHDSGYENQTFYIGEGNKEFNIIILNDDEFDAWKYATERMFAIPRQEIQLKANRISLFEKYVKEYMNEN